MKVQGRIDIAVPPDELYGVVMDAHRLGDWVTIHAGLKQAPAGELEEGSELVQCLKLAGQRFNVRWKVVEADRPRRVVWHGRGPVRSRARAVYEFIPNGDATSFSYLNEYELPGGPMGRLAGRAVAGTAERESARSLERLKRLVEP